jgi:hypothetical protein
MELE